MMSSGRILGLSFFMLLLEVRAWTTPRPKDTSNTSFERRDVLHSFAKMVTTTYCIDAIFLTPTIAGAQDESMSTSVSDGVDIPQSKPSAPVEKMIPAVKVKLNVEKSLEIAKSMKEEDTTAWLTLRDMLLLPQNYTSGSISKIPTAPAKAYLDTYQRNREKLPWVAQPGAIMVQSGEIMAWKRLKRKEYQQEKEDEIRAAFNLYTSALNYNAESYLLNVPAAERKQMVRQDRLPDIKQVIQSDMGLRYLYRNEFLTAIQQVRDEIEYQLAESVRSKEDLVILLEGALVACNHWFELIDKRDVEEAMNALLQG